MLATRAARLLPLLLGVTVLLMSAPNANGQESRLDAVVKQFESLGLDRSATVRRFRNAFTERPANPSETIDALADQVAEIRLFLTGQPNVVTGEIAIAGRTRLTEISLSLGNEVVRFVDSGEAPDRAKGDGVFSASLKLDTVAEFAALTPQLRASVDAVRGQSQAKFVRRGPRDIVPVRDAIEQWRVKSPGLFATLRDSVDQAVKLLEFRDPLLAARALNIDLARTPFLVIPGPQLDPKARIKLLHLFDVPIVPVFPFPPAGPPVPIDQARSLMVVAPTVVEDPGRTFDACTGAGTATGAWSFGHLMRELAFGTTLSAEDFALLWLSNWSIAQEANGWIVNETVRAAELQTRVIDSWQRLSPGGVLNVDFFPARLFAIVNRPDLADKIGYGTAGNAGEGRLVFGLMEKPLIGACSSLRFTVIFEFGVKGGSCSAVKAWHQRWKNLDTLVLGSAPYNAALELITRDFTEHGTNPSQLPNMSSLNQLRTNENALDFVWQLREFRLQPIGASVPAGLLDLVTVKQTPDDSFNGTGALGAFLLAKEDDIVNDRHVVPDRFPLVLDRFLGARSNAPVPSGFWNPLSLAGLTDPAEARRKFSLATCNACHTGETGTFFTHIGSAGTRALGSPAALSPFLTGIDITVPVTGGIHHYEDLAERQTAMSNILTRSCFSLLGIRRLPFVH